MTYCAACGLRVKESSRKGVALHPNCYSGERSVRQELRTRLICAGLASGAAAVNAVTTADDVLSILDNEADPPR